MTREIGRGVLALAVALAFSPNVSAQPIAQSLEELGERLRATRQAVIVTDVEGRRVTGLLSGLDAQTLSILVQGRTETFAAAQVREVDLQTADQLLNGALIGLAVGFAVPAAICSGRSDSSETGACVLGSLLLGGLPGLGLGLGLDALQKHTEPVFRAAGAQQAFTFPCTRPWSRRGACGAAFRATTRVSW